MRQLQPVSHPASGGIHVPTFGHPVLNCLEDGIFWVLPVFRRGVPSSLSPKWSTHFPKAAQKQNRGDWIPLTIKGGVGPPWASIFWNSKQWALGSAGSLLHLLLIIACFAANPSRQSWGRRRGRNTVEWTNSGKVRPTRWVHCQSIMVCIRESTSFYTKCALFFFIWLSQRHRDWNTLRTMSPNQSGRRVCDWVECFCFLLSGITERRD